MYYAMRNNEKRFFNQTAVLRVVHKSDHILIKKVQDETTLKFLRSLFWSLLEVIEGFFFDQMNKNK